MLSSDRIHSQLSVKKNRQIGSIIGESHRVSFEWSGTPGVMIQTAGYLFMSLISAFQQDGAGLPTHNAKLPVILARNRSVLKLRKGISSKG
jgi:hypothetical protein